MLKNPEDRNELLYILVFQTTKPTRLYCDGFESFSYNLKDLEKIMSDCEKFTKEEISDVRNYSMKKIEEMKKMVCEEKELGEQANTDLQQISTQTQRRRKEVMCEIS